MSTLSDKALEIAKSYIGQMEEPKGSNWGEFVQGCLKTVGITVPSFWCASFVYRCFSEAAQSLGITNPVPKTGHCLTMRNKTPGANKVKKPFPGCIFIIKIGNKGSGHTGIVCEVDEAKGLYRAVEGNSDPEGGHNGVGVFIPKWRKIADANCFLSF